MSAGRLIAVVGPSGVGKDSVMAELVAQWPELCLLRRVITRAPDLGGEAYEAVSPETFERMVAEGAFCVHWGAHTLRYGIPSTAFDQVRAGQWCLANFSRDALVEAARIFPALTVLNLTASPETLAARLATRGRETPQVIAQRLAQADKALPPGLDVITLSNDGALDETVARTLAALQPVRA
ncbi:phosphonate metabolism protein/1,5-bisphosphokinase (PRPP-forming) PhnN [Dinoroseobacter sp. S375]|uniref:phosphonate metabolism protein/1,5-bisphosphokinase (PRPP-forming) PhnN n=1 Tax=Dinoroseobacter sp. S375 TaxID=3415136 RepID=UPI003C7B4FA3